MPVPLDDDPPRAAGPNLLPAAAAPRASAGVVGLLCALVLVFYAWLASTDLWISNARHPERGYYNLLVDGFHAGHLAMNAPVPPALAQLPDPYDPIANEPYRLHDASFYHGKYYLYFGVAPAVLLFWPYLALTGQHLSQQQATMLFCATGFLAAAGLFFAAVRRYFPRASLAAIAIGVLGVGLTDLVPVLLGRAEVYEVPIACGFAGVMLALGAIWQALHFPVHRDRWLAAGGLAYGVAIAARPSLLPGGIFLVLPILHAWWTARAAGPTPWLALARSCAALLAPLVAIGVALMIYNYERFDSPWEFGQRYQLAGTKVANLQLFHSSYFWINVRVYFFSPLRWSTDFPFAQGIRVPSLPPGHFAMEGVIGALANIPFLWFAAAAAFAGWRRTAPGSLSVLRWFLVAAALAFAFNAAVVCLFGGGSDRYEVDFLPALALLASLGVLVLEDATGRSRARPLVLGLVALVLLASATVNWLTSFKSNPESQTAIGHELAGAGAYPEAIEKYRAALRTEPDFPYAHHGLAYALAATGHLPEAIDHFRAALRAMPDLAEAHNGLGVALLRQKDPAAALVEFEAAARLAPRLAEAHFDCAVALLQLNRPAEAIPRLEETLRLHPDFPGARDRLDAARRLAAAPR